MVTLREIAHALGGAVSSGQVLCPGPRHSARDRSLSVKLSAASGDGFVVHSFAGDNPIACKDYVRARLGLPSFERQERDARHRAPPPKREPEPPPNKNAGRAGEIWREAGPIRGTLAERYLQSRGITLDADHDWHAVLRFHSRCPFKIGDNLERHPALVALMRDVQTNGPRAVQRTKLTNDGRKIERLTLGPSGAAAIKLDPDEDVTMGLHVGEGLETCLTARQLGLRPVWAAGGTATIQNFPVLAGIDCVALLAETGEGNAKAIAECSKRWREAGREVLIVRPKAGSDLNDSIREVQS